MTTSIRHTFGLGLLLLAGAAQAADVPINLWARQGTTTLPNGATALVVGYVEAPDTTVTAPGGPVLAVNQGDVVTVTLVNALAEPTGMVFQGQSMVPDTTGVAPGGSASYTFTASSPGTFLYEAAPLPNAQHQAPLGLHGALVVRPSIAGQAYEGAGTAYDDEAVLVLSELDPAVWPNPGANPALFDMRNFAPKYFLINGKAYPDTDPIPTEAAGRRVLLRYVNAGIQQHSMTVLGTVQTLVGKDGSQLGYAGNRAAETIAPGETLDAIVTVPAAARTGSQVRRFRRQPDADQQRWPRPRRDAHVRRGVGNSGRRRWRACGRVRLRPAESRRRKRGRHDQCIHPRCRRSGVLRRRHDRHGPRHVRLASLVHRVPPGGRPRLSRVGGSHPLRARHRRRGPGPLQLRGPEPGQDGSHHHRPRPRAVLLEG